MNQTAIIETLNYFSSSYELDLVYKKDGGYEHSFLYSKDHLRRYVYLLNWNTIENNFLLKKNNFHNKNFPFKINNLFKENILWIMLNPGLGETENRIRRTFERCKNWSMGWGFDGMVFVNLCSIRTRNAKCLTPFLPDTDPLNNSIIESLIKLKMKAIVAWGSHGAKCKDFPSLDSIEAYCFGYTRTNNQPRHPLYVSNNTTLQIWKSAY
ncbi:MAG: hypothetical protein A0129_12630 [Limnobacter sp. CACIAM 66H1]|uniref:DUF1643 domain-containing protein n=1 Tax=Limnobacter sp. CACIAM 66H1 TaxID=1813033 RepID=UPI0007A80ED7|nr:DUF1643 domain-containing protein [Limnobacter sp. CACIAM 66H1]KYP10484.1 MAG: hypothetical protein A0129_12630 [Limnobacter sp. CACIAM 66H1]